jgi:hypothetical protein
MRKVVEVALIIVTLGLARIFISIPNLEPIGAVALFGGAMLGLKNLRFLVPLAALFIGDLIYAAIVPGYSEYLFSWSQFFVYGSYAAIIFLGSRLLSKSSNRSTGRIIGTAVLASILFFLVTNFGTWFMGVQTGVSMYTSDLSGLLTCYAAGLAFYKGDFLQNFALNHMVGTVVFSLLVFKAYEIYQQKFVLSSGKAA